MKPKDKKIMKLLSAFAAASGCSFVAYVAAQDIYSHPDDAMQGAPFGGTGPEYNRYKDILDRPNDETRILSQ